MSDVTSTTVSPPQPNPKVLEARWLHGVMMFFQSFAYRSTIINWLILLVFWSLITVPWILISPSTALIGAFVLTVVLLFDLALLWLLPRRNISFGPIAPQFVVMFLPRLAVTALALLISIWQPLAGLALFAILQLLGTASFWWGMLIEAHQLSLTTLTVTSPHLPPNAPPIRLLHLSDLHVEYLTRRENRVLELIAGAKPDLIVITGDYLNLSYNQDPEAIAQVRRLLSQIDAPFGVYATLGSPPVDLPEIAVQHFTNSHIQLLRHNFVDLDLGEGRRLTLLGMDCSHDITYDEYQFKALYQKAAVSGQRSAVNILLYHSPELMPVVQNYEVDLHLCGHTHGGQVRIPGYGAVITSAVTGKRYEMGCYDENGTTLYVSRGIGMEGMSAPRIRLFCPPEVTLINLEGA